MNNYTSENIILGFKAAAMALNTVSFTAAGTIGAILAAKMGVNEAPIYAAVIGGLAGQSLNHYCANQFGQRDAKPSEYGYVSGMKKFSARLGGILGASIVGMACGDIFADAPSLQQLLDASGKLTTHSSGAADFMLAAGEVLSVFATWAEYGIGRGQGARAKWNERRRNRTPVSPL